MTHLPRTVEVRRQLLPLLVLPFLLADQAGLASELPTLEISVGRNPAVLYEPVVLAYVFRNSTSTSLTTNSPLDEIHVSISREGSPPQRYNTGIGRACVVEAFRTFPPGYARFRDQVLTWNSPPGVLAFPEPGVYQIDAGIQVNDAFIKAKPIHITIVEPAEPDRLAIQALGSPDAMIRQIRFGLKEFCEQRMPATCVEDFRTFLAQHRTSAYTPYLTWDFASFLSATTGVIPTDTGLATRILRDFLSTSPRDPLAPILTRFLVSLLGRVAAEKVAAQFSLHWPERPETANALLDYFPPREEQEP